MEKTTNYQLPKWEKSDFIKMDDFNDAFGKLDAALKAASDSADTANSGVTALAQDLGAGGQNCRAVTGSYTGTGTYGEANKLTIQTPFKPLMLFVTNSDTSANQHMVVWLRGMAAGDNGYNGRTVVLEWGERAVSWYSTTTGVNGPAYLHLNGSGVTYQYTVFGC